MGGWIFARLQICCRAARKFSSRSSRFDPSATAVLIVVVAVIVDRGSRGQRPRLQLQSKHILHAVKTCGFPDDPARRAQCSPRKNLTTCCTMRHLKTLARPAKNYGMFADHIAFADRLNRDLIIGIPRLAQNGGEGLRGSAGRVFLHLMMRFNNFNIEFSAKCLRSITRHSEKHVHACAEVRRENNRNGLGGSFNRGALFRGMSGCSNNEWSLIL